LLFGKLAFGGEVHVSLKEDAQKVTTLSFELTPAAPKLVKRKMRKPKAGTTPEPNIDEA
jgi:ATP-dependent Clp protease ATP-binding subunit ClpA